MNQGSTEEGEFEGIAKGVIMSGVKVQLFISSLKVLVDQPDFQP